MTDTIPDITVDKDLYVDINNLSSIAAGTALIITNKSTSRISLQISAAQPAADSSDGEIIFPGPSAQSIKLITALENIVWAKALDDVNSPLSVQDNT